MKLSEKPEQKPDPITVNQVGDFLFMVLCLAVLTAGFPLVFFVIADWFK